MEGHFDGFGAAFEDGPDFGEGEFGGKPQAEQFAFIIVEGLQVLGEVLQAFVLQDLGERIVFVRVIVILVQGDDRAFAPVMVNGASVGDGEQPRGERAPVAIPGQSLQRFDENLRGQILSIGLVLYPTIQITVHGSQVAAIQCVERFRVLPGGIHEKGFVRKVGGEGVGEEVHVMKSISWEGGKGNGEVL